MSHAEPTTRHLHVFQKALQVFVRYGYRKTSMEDVARAAGVSRQTLYVNFRTKASLFRGMVEQVLHDALGRAQGEFNDPARPVQERLLSGFDEWCGVFVDSVLRSPHSHEILEAGDTITGDLIASYEADFALALESTLTSAMTKTSTNERLEPKRIVDVLVQTSTSVKYNDIDREQYLALMSTAIEMACVAIPIDERGTS